VGAWVVAQAPEGAHEGTSVNQRFNIYCDESSHLEHDGLNPMVIGAVVCPQARAREIADAIRALKRQRGLKAPYELKWSRVSPSFVELYESVVELFFNDADLRFRAVIIDKTLLRHEDFEQDHDTFYYKMHHTLLKQLIVSPHEHFVYMDIKDTRSAKKMRKLREVLCNEKHDFHGQVTRCVEPVRSEQVEQSQLADILIGAVAYANREPVQGAAQGTAKTRLVELIRRRSGLDLTSTTGLWAAKFNILRWVPGGG
jgi:hypothetical protein